MQEIPKTPSESSWSLPSPSSNAVLPVAQARVAEHAVLTQAAVKFEAFFVAQMMKQMRQATAALADQDSPINREVNQASLALADHAVADTLAAQRAFGIADVLVRQMSGSVSAPQAERNLSRNLS